MPGYNKYLFYNDKNTTDFSATENDSDSESLNLTSSDNIIIYSYVENQNIHSQAKLNELKTYFSGIINNEESIEYTRDKQKLQKVIC